MWYPGLMDVLSHVSVHGLSILGWLWGSTTCPSRRVSNTSSRQSTHRTHVRDVPLYVLIRPKVEPSEALPVFWMDLAGSWGVGEATEAIY